MKRLLLQLRNLLRRDDGPTTTEYAVFLALILIVVLNAVQTLGCTAKATFNNAASAIGASS